MRRVLWFLKWKATWWICQKSLCSDAQSDIQEGLAAYSEKQSAMLWKMGRQFADQWYSLLVGNGLLVDWPEEFLVGHPTIPIPQVSSDVVHDDDPLPVDEDDDVLPVYDEDDLFN
jgi:hypothetical protein